MVEAVTYWHFPDALYTGVPEDLEMVRKFQKWAMREVKTRLGGYDTISFEVKRGIAEARLLGWMPRDWRDPLFGGLCACLWYRVPQEVLGGEIKLFSSTPAAKMYRQKRKVPQ